jgi:hypothetical protein
MGLELLGALTFLFMEKHAIKFVVEKLNVGYLCPGITRGMSCYLLDPLELDPPLDLEPPPE